MEYAVVGITALIITLIICHSYIFTTKVKEFPIQKRTYRLFILSVILFYAVDILWGLFDDLKVLPLLYTDTVIFFVSIGITALLWTRFLTVYIGGKGKTNAFMLGIGFAMLIFVIVMLIINIFNPILFEFKDGEYIAKTGRYFLFLGQLIIFTLSAFGSLVEAFSNRNPNKKNRFLVISVFSIAMIVAIVFQLLYPLLPFYSIGCMVGVCLVNTFVAESEKEESRLRLEVLLKKEIENQQELSSTKALVYKDSLTGANSKFAYVEMEEKIDKLINARLINNFSVVVFDINGLKQVNDTFGHQAGDKYIKDCYKIITDIYGDNKIYRFGGDEFVTVLEDEEYEKREELLNKFNEIIDKNLTEDKPVLSTGMSDFDRDNDNTYRSVFIRADKLMYDRKKLLKSKGAKTR